MSPRPTPAGGAAELGWRPGERAWLLGFPGLVVTATLAPVRQNRRPKERRIDGFPLSYYPMFGKRRWATAVMAQLPEHTELAHLVRVEIVLGEFDLDACMLARRADGNETVLAFAELGTTSRLPASPSSEVITRAWA